MQETIITTGLNGLVGSKFANDFKQEYQFHSLDLRHPTQPVDITNYESVIQAFAQTPEAKFVLHLAAFTDVTAAWNQQGDKNGLVYKINVDGTKNIIKACEQTGKHLIHISTAYVFNGEKEDLYSENDVMQPIEWYGQTKAWAEEAVTNSDLNWTILRIDQPFRSDRFERADMAHKIIQGLQANQLYPMFDNHYFGPTFVDDFAKIIDFIIRTQQTGLFHASSGEKWSDYDFALALKEGLNLPGEVKKGDLSAYLKTLNRPYQKNTALDCSKLKNILDFQLKNIKSAIKEIKI